MKNILVYTLCIIIIALISCEKADSYPEVEQEEENQVIQKKNEYTVLKSFKYNGSGYMKFLSITEKGAFLVLGHNDVKDSIYVKPHPHLLCT